MKRNMNLVVEVLDKLESLPPSKWLSAEDVESFDFQEVAGHMDLLKKEGFIEAQIQMTSHDDAGYAAALAITLTNRGHDYLEELRAQK